MSDNAQRMERLVSAFQTFDSGLTGRIPLAFLTTVLSRFGQPFTKEELAEFVSDADNGSGQVDYQHLIREVMFASTAA